MRLNLVLLIAVIASALYLVRTQYESRRLYAEVDRARNDARKLETEHERLQVEKRAQATPARVERLAKEQLQMRSPTPAITQYVNAGAAVRQGAATGAGAAPVSRSAVPEAHSTAARRAEVTQ
jgi:cell division protein FtsL